MTGIAAFILLGFTVVHGFVPFHHFAKCVRCEPVHLSGGSDGHSSDDKKRSRLEGNTREPTKEELVIMDEMITKLAAAKAYDLPNAVRRAFRVVSSPVFFIRIAELADASDEVEKEKLSALASNLVSTIDALVSTTEDRLDETAREVERVVKAASEPDGEFLVPLTLTRLDAMRRTLKQMDPMSLDEGFLSTVDSWMNKSHKDGMDGMVVILQKVLQMYAGVTVSRARAALAAQREESKIPAAAALFEKLLSVDSDQWDSEITSGLQNVPSEELLGEAQRTIEHVVLALENGSMAQRVQAEFLRELVTRIESKTTPASLE